MDEKKRIIEFDAAESVPVDGQMAIDSASQGTKKITPALLLKNITDLLGNVPLETQAQVLTAAVNEVNAKAAQATHLTQAEWDALPNTKYTDDVAYFITDGESTVGTALWTKVGTAGLNTNAKNCSGAINELKGTLTDFTTYTEIGVLSSSHTTLTFSKAVYKVLFLYITVGTNTVYINTLPINSQYAISNGQTFKLKDFDGNSFIFTVSISGNNITFTYSSSSGANAVLRVLGYK